MLEPVTAVGVRPHPEHALVGVQDVPYRAVAVGVDADLEVVPVRILDRFVDFLRRHRQDAVVVGADVGCAHVHRPA